MKIEKFMFTFNNQMLPDFFNNYFTKLDNVHNDNIRKNKLKPIFLGGVLVALRVFS